ncbi:hypothetical protein SuNHUV7_21480 (plasmid) [Pseudoseohaeicola sp. NH-UV-7]
MTTKGFKMDLTIEYEYKPEGALLVHSGGLKEDEGGAWRPLVFQIGPGKYQSGVIRKVKGAKPVLHRAILDDLGFARHVAEELARLAAA